MQQHLPLEKISDWEQLFCFLTELWRYKNIKHKKIVMSSSHLISTNRQNKLTADGPYYIAGKQRHIWAGLLTHISILVRSCLDLLNRRLSIVVNKRKCHSHILNLEILLILNAWVNHNKLTLPASPTNNYITMRTLFPGFDKQYCLHILVTFPPACTDPRTIELNRDQSSNVKPN